MLDLKDDRLVVESKGIYSIENFLMSRRLMYWQVYLHKTAVAAEKMLINTLRRAKELSLDGVQLFASPSLSYFLLNEPKMIDFENYGVALQHFVNLDDNDIWISSKSMVNHIPTRYCHFLSSGMVNRKLFKIEVSSEQPDLEKISEYLKVISRNLIMPSHEASYLCSLESVTTDMYREEDDSIDILMKDGSVKDIAQASDILNIELLSKKVEKYYFAYLKI